MDKAAFIRSTIGRMAEFTFPYIGSVAGLRDRENGQLVGSALRLTLAGRPVLASALHVFEQANTFPGVAFSAGPDQPPHLLQGHVHFERAGDVAVHQLGPDYAPSNVAFWPQERVEQSDESTLTDFLFIHGFPGAQSRFVRLFDSLFAQSLPYGAMQQPDGLSVGLAPHQFAINFDPSTMRRSDTGGNFFVDPHGMSGSPVWRIGVAGRTASEWNPHLSRLVGIVTDWSEADRVLIATRARHLFTIPM